MSTPERKYLYRPQSLPREHITRHWHDFYLEIADDEAPGKLFAVLHDYFSKQNYNPALVEKWYNTYWMWYVKLSWSRLLTLEHTVLPVLIPKQCATAFQLGIEVEQLTLNALYRRIDVDNLADVYLQIQREIKDSSIPLAGADKQALTIGAVAKKYSRLIKDQNDLKRAEFFIEMEKALFPQESPLVFVWKENQSERTRAFLDFLDFFAENHDIEGAVAAYAVMLGERGQIGLEDIDIEGIVGITPEMQRAYAEKQVSSNGVALIDIQQQIEHEFPKDESGKFVNTENVLARLDDLAQTHGDDRIRDLLIFDEVSGEFMWNDELLS